MRILRWLGWTAWILAVAAVVHWSVITYLPDVIMWRVSSAIARKGSNLIAHGDRPTAASRTVVKPSPDLLYSTCVYDVSRAPVKITTAAPTDTYWSVALYASNTDNFFVLNDTMAKGQPTTIIVVGEGQIVPPQPESAYIVTALTPRGVVLFRTLVNDDAREAELDQQRRAAKCEPLVARESM
jgi:uncharacterized membrane protein